MTASKNQLRYRYGLTQTTRPRNGDRPKRRQRRRSRLETLEARAMLAADIDFGTAAISSYGGGQDAGGVATVENDGASLRLSGNTWKAIELPYDVTADTVLEFDFQSSNEGEIHGIGFDNDRRLSNRRIFELYGTQRWGLQSFNDYAEDAPESTRYRIPVGEFFTGEFEFLVLANDHDASGGDAESVFSNVRVFEDASLPQPVDDAFTVNAGQLAILDVLVNDLEDVDEDDSLTLTAIGDTSAGGTVSIESNRIVYRAQDSFAGVETFRYTVVNEAGHAASAQVAVTVTASDPAGPGVVLQLPGDLQFSGQRDGHVTIPHSSDLALAEGTYSLSFVAEDVGGRNALFSKDASGYGEGGHLTALVENGKLKVRFQSTTKSV
ncbi:MAG: Ig-like domain-containing protein [Planctomycetota bacterium]